MTSTEKNMLTSASMGTPLAASGKPLAAELCPKKNVFATVIPSCGMLPKTIADRKARLRRKTSSVSSMEEDVLEMYFTCGLELGVMPNGAV